MYGMDKEFSNPDPRKVRSSEGFGAIIMAFLGGTTAHGLPRVATENSSWRKAFWAIVFIGAFAYFSYLTYIAVETFMSNPVGINIEFNMRNEAEFPAVTICNKNPLKKSKLPRTVYESLNDIDDEYFKKMIAQRMSKGGTSTQKGLEPSNNTMDEAAKEARMQDLEEKERSAPEGVNFENSDFTSNAANDYDFKSFISYSKTDDYSDLTDLLKPSKSELDALGHQAEDFILQCSFDRTNCTYLDFYKVYNNRYGNCYVFNHGFNGTATKVTTKYGSRYGLRLTLNLEKSEYIGLYSHEVGVRIAVHPTNVTGFPEDEGVNAASGTSTSIGITTTSYGRLPEPYTTQCADGSGKQLLDEKEYTVWACMLACLQNKLMSDCGCSDQAGLGENETRCSITNSTQEVCRQTIYYKYNRGSLGCDCRVPCKEVHYNPKVSMASWPSLFYIPILWDQVGSKLETKGFKRLDDAVETLARVHVYMEDFTVQRIEEYPTYTDMDLLAAMGGYLGLFVGISICTVLEFLEFLMDILIMCGVACSVCCQQSCGNRKHKSQRSNRQITPVEEVKIPPPGPEIQVVNLDQPPGHKNMDSMTNTGFAPNDFSPQYTTQW